MIILPAATAANVTQKAIGIIRRVGNSTRFLHAKADAAKMEGKQSNINTDVDKVVRLNT